MVSNIIISFKIASLSLIFFPISQCQKINIRSDDRLRYVYTYRRMIWCIAGRGEHPLYEWPLVQLKPFLLEQEPRTFEDNFKSEEEMKASKIVAPKNIQVLLNNVACNKSIDVGDENNLQQRIHVLLQSDVKFQAAIIQAVHAPFGLGFPFGQFHLDDEYKCGDCKNMIGKVVGCLSRPDISMMHPTVGVYHHHLWKNSSKLETHGEVNEVHWNFRFHHHFQCHSAHNVEFWVMLILDIHRKIWVTTTVKTCLAQHAWYEPVDEVDEDTKVNLHQTFFASPLGPGCYTWPPPRPGLLNPKCSDPEYEDDPACKSRKLEIAMYNREIPYPRVEVKCHSAGSYPIRTKSPGDPEELTPIRMVGDYAVKCIAKHPTRLRAPYKVCPQWHGKMICKHVDDPLNYGPNKVKDGDQESRLFPYSFCRPCRKAEPEPEVASGGGAIFIKRNFHGSFMILAFLFLLPASLMISRFYKETLHTRQFKGFRIWLLVHVAVCCVAMIMSYAAYTTPVFFRVDAHIYFGYGATSCLVIGFLSGWPRPKDPPKRHWIFYVHSLSGYSAWGLGIASLLIHHALGNAARLVVYIAVCTTLSAILALTFHVCSMDSNLKMLPSRQHVPVVQIRFDDIIPPGEKFRLIFLGSYLGFLFILCLCILCL